MDEREGSRLLTEEFVRAGYDVQADVAMTVGSATIHLDGWDANKRVGFEFVTDEAGDRAEFDATVLNELEAMIGRGECHVLLVDEHEGLAEPELRRVAQRFLAEVAKRPLR